MNIKVNIGSGDTKIDGFVSVDKYFKGADVVADMDSLPFVNKTVDVIYSSHVLYYANLTAIRRILIEWHRVLDYHGELYLSVLDFDKIVELYEKSCNEMTRPVHCFLFGLQRYDWMYHKICFNFKFLEMVLKEAGFHKIQKIDKFPFEVKDCSAMVDSTYGIKMSLNVKAVR